MDVKYLAQGETRTLHTLPSTSTIAIFTGSFDPAHTGHIETAYQALCYAQDVGYPSTDPYLSSSALRNGDQEMGFEYQPVIAEIQHNYSKARIRVNGDAR